MLAAVLAAPALATVPAAAAEAGNEQEVEVTDTALYASPVGDALPSTLTRDVPPEALCVLEPQLCPQEVDPVRTLLRDVVETTQQVPAEPVHPIPPDTVAVSYLAGNPRYQSALRFAVPAPPADEDYGRVELVLAQGEPTYHLDSPAFRRVVLGAFAALGEQDPEVAVEGVVDALEREDLVATEQVMGIEACPLTAPFEPGGAPFAQPDDDIPRSSEDDESPAIDCLFGSDGQYDEDAGVWRFDLTMTATAWQEGDLDNHGILLQPSGAPNLAFGDPDTSTNAQVVLDVTSAVLALEFQAPLPPVDDASDEASDPGPPPADGGTDGFDDDGFDDAGFDDAGFDDVGSSSSPPVSGGGGGDGDLASPDLDAADAETAAAVAGDGDAVRAVSAADDWSIDRPWWVWLLIPAFLGGASLVGRTLGDAPASTGGHGAMSRLASAGGRRRNVAG